MINIGPKQGMLFAEPDLTSWLPDESFHSLVSRQHILFGSTIEATCRRLFRRKRWLAKHDLPVGLRTFVEATKGVLGDVRDIIAERTVAPFFLAMAPFKRVEHVVEAMTEPGVTSVCSRLGLLRRAVAHGHPLKACIRCIEADLYRFSVAYWHRSHQCPGVWLCPIHGEMLLVARDPQRTPSGWYLPRPEILVMVCDPRDADGGEMLKLLDRLARYSLAFLENGLEDGRYRHVALCAVRARLAARGFCGPGGNVRIERLTQAISTFWEPIRPMAGVLLLMGVDSSFRRALSELLTDRRPLPHPLVWIALLGTLFDTWEDVRNEYEKSTTSSQVNVAKSYPATRSLALHDERVDVLRSALAAGKTLKKACREADVGAWIARRWCVIHDIDRSKKFGKSTPEQIERIQELYLSGQTIQGIAARLVVDVSIVRRALDAKEGIKLARKARSLIQKRSTFREEVLRMVRENDPPHRSTLRRKNSSIYYWMLNFDRRWFETHVPSTRAAIETLRPVDLDETQGSLF